VKGEESVGKQCPCKGRKRGEKRDKYSIRESEGDKIVQKDEETDEDGKTAGKEKKIQNHVQRGSDGGHTIEK